ncbi:MAG: nucleotide exchange factor GrpE [candidate division NC10 bacterium]|nr:nucleotide exchange factor GrpE [candidate division NC10 bacterium]
MEKEEVREIEADGRDSSPEGEKQEETSPAGGAVSPNEELARLSAALGEKTKEFVSLNDRLLRLAAEFDNYKKRVAREREEFVKSANEGVILEFLPILDNLERALMASKMHGNAHGLVEGVEMIHRLFLSTLEKFGVKPIQALGKEFDPSFHQAVLQVEDPEGRENIVVEEVQRGYILENRVIRPAMVKVSKTHVPRSALDVQDSEPLDLETENLEPRT